MKIRLKNLEETQAFAQLIGERLCGGEVFELVGDVGAGKTTFTKGLGAGLMVDDDVQSPSFTLSRVYSARDGLELHHYDFYRLNEAGVLGYELAESLDSPQVITVVEWAETVADVLPEDRTILTFTSEGVDESVRTLNIVNPNKAIEEAYAAWTKD